VAEPVPPVASVVPKGTALEAARDYIAMVKDDRSVDATLKYWNFEIIFQSVFGDDLAKLSEKERTEARELLVRFMKQVLTNPQVSKVMASSAYEDFHAAPAGDGRTAVSFLVVLADGSRRIPNTMVFQPAGGKWRIVDMGNSGRMLVVDLVSAYGTWRKAKPKGSPLDYVREMVAQIGIRPAPAPR